MSEYQKKITELPAKAAVLEGDFFPAADPSADTNKVTLTQLRNTINFENAFMSLAEGIAATNILQQKKLQ
ncbi:hypothetical protein TOTORO_02010 [Serratia phage vB_SmaS-Totoro]|nr:hypothetical protein TOTORO_02010 [Serratia phage vB_SmaS-Totoro]